MNTSHHPTTGSRGRAKALLLVLFGGLALLLGSPYLASQDGMRSSGEGANSDGGDNPVVGSLPCAVDPELDLKFVQATGSPGVSLPVPTLGYVGPDLRDGILAADGIPEGRVNRRGDFDILGLVKPGTVTVSRDDLRDGEIELLQWVPDSFKGGCVTSSGTMGPSKIDLNGNLTPLPVRAAAQSLLFVVDQWYFISPPTPPGGQALPPIRVHVSMTPTLATITYLP
jgi:hypothetical protein